MENPETIDDLESVYELLPRDEIEKRQVEAKTLSRKIDNLEFLASAELELCLDGKSTDRLLKICIDAMNTRKKILDIIPIARETKEIRNEISEGLRKVIKFYNLVNEHGSSILTQFVDE